MAIYELRTYTLFVGKIQEASEIYKELGTPWINKFKKNLVNYYLGDIGALNQIIHIWKFEDDNDRRRLWKQIFSDEDFIKFAAKFRPLVLNQENKLMTQAPWVEK